MSISIKSLSIEQLGPLSGRTLDFARLNLIYGPNETGKTYLVEFILRALFRQLSDWPLRTELGRGKVVLSGLPEGELTFTPEGRQKLEDFWGQDGGGLPTNMARLMIVKGAELALTEANRSGLDRAVLKAALSSEPLIDRILNGIQATVRGANLVDGRIEGAHKGELKTHADLETELHRLTDLLEQVDRRYSGGRLRSLELEQQGLKEQLEQQQAAKRHLAYQLHQQREELRAKLAKLPKQRLDDLERDITRHQELQRQITSQREKWESAKLEAEHYPWLKQAVALWEGRGLERVGRRISLLAIGAAGLSMLGLLLALALTVLNLSATVSLLIGIASVASFGFGMGLWVIYVFRTQPQAMTSVDLEERNQIEQEYGRRFGRAPGGLAGLKAQEGALLEKQVLFTSLGESIEETEGEIERLTTTIEQHLKELQAEKAGPTEWSAVARQTREWEQSLTEQLHDLDLRLSKLDVDPSDYQSEPPASEYSAERMRELQRQLEQVERDYENSSADLDRLRQEIVRETGGELRAPWEQLLEGLRAQQQQAEADYRKLTAHILGQIGVVQVLERLRTEEDLKIREALQAPEVGSLLQAVTGTYHSLDMVEGQLLARGESADYPLAELSTGAREQVLLALRMGFASRLAGGAPLFLILDDAFQHSDYERRERLVEQVVRLVEAGWQVTYLTMDDHLSDLFHRVGMQSFGDDYRQHVLEL